MTMTTLPLDTLSDVSLSDSSSNLYQSPNTAQSQAAPTIPNNILKRNRKRKKKRFNGDLSMYNDPEISKWWKRRYDLFERFDEGIQLDKVSWYSVTSEEIARRQAEVCRCDLIIDGFAGAGGNSVQFAQKCGFVISIDNSLERLKCLDNNAMVYGVKNRIDIICGDLATVLSAFRTIHISSTPTRTADESDEYISENSISVEKPSHSSSKSGEKDSRDLFLGSNHTLRENEIINMVDRSGGNTSTTSENVLANQCAALDDLVIQSNCKDNLILDNNTMYVGEENSLSIVDVVFMSPPWGGPQYKSRILPPGSSSWNKKKRKQWFDSLSEELEPSFNLDDIDGLTQALSCALNLSSRVCIYLPRNTAIGQVLKLGWSGFSDSQNRVNVAIEDYWLRGRRMAIGAYLGDFPSLSAT